MTRRRARTGIGVLAAGVFAGMMLAGNGFAAENRHGVAVIIGNKDYRTPDVPDAHSPRYWPAPFVHYLDSYGQNKVIFETDFPVLGFGRAIDEIAGLGLKPGARRKLLRDNALRVYSLGDGDAA